AAIQDPRPAISIKFRVHRPVYLGYNLPGLSSQRPPHARMAPLPAKPDMKDRILQTAVRLFYLQGIRAIGVDTIAAEIGISKRTLYNHFPSKDALIAAYLARRFVQPRPSDKPPVEQILSTFDSLERRFASKDFRGCPFVNAVAELGPEDQPV